MAVILDTPGFCMERVLYCSNFGLRFNDFNLYVMGKKYVLSLLSAILVLCNRVESSKITRHIISDNGSCLILYLYSTKTNTSSISKMKFKDSETGEM